MINVWVEHGHVETTRRALAHWAMETASLTPRLPGPEVGIDALLRLGLATAGPNGSMRPAASLRAITTRAEPPDRLPAQLRRLVLERLLGIEECAWPLRDALGYATIESGTLRVLWRGLPEGVQANPAWLWLQEMELAEHNGDILLLDDSLRGLVLDADVRKPVMSQAELEERLAAQRERAWLAEEHVVGLERKRLTDGGAAEYGEAVRRVSLENALAGYDVESYELDGRSRSIEVKCSSGPRDRFFLSRSERETAERLGARYWIAWIGWASRLPEGPCDVAWFREPVRLWNRTDSPWRMSYEDAIVQRVREDREDASEP